MGDDDFVRPDIWRGLCSTAIYLSTPNYNVMFVVFGWLEFAPGLLFWVCLLVLSTGLLCADPVSSVLLSTKHKSSSYTSDSDR